MEWAKELKAGDSVKVTGFQCIPNDAVVRIEEDEEGCLYFPCSVGNHYLNGQWSPDGFIGLTKSEKDTTK